MADDKRDEYEYISPDDPNAELKKASRDAAFWYDRDHQNSFRVYHLPKLPNLVLYFMVLAMSAAFSIWIGQKIKHAITHHVEPMTKKRNDMIDDLIQHKRIQKKAE